MSQDTNPPATSSKDHFGQFANSCSSYLGSRWAFAAAVGVIVAWAITGPIYHYSDTWQLIINTGTTIVTFLMVFLIQNTQNRDAVTIQLKLDELLRGVAGARTSLVDLENLSDEDIALLRKEFTRMQISAAKREKEAAVDSLEEIDSARNSSITR
jgi:low affinity Fe/Cu permease